MSGQQCRSERLSNLGEGWGKWEGNFVNEAKMKMLEKKKGCVFFVNGREIFFAHIILQHPF